MQVFCDRFTRNAVILMIITISLMISLGSYAGGELKGTVESAQEHSFGGQNGMASVPAVNTIGEGGEFAGLTLAGMVSGLIIGYYWSSIFGSDDDV